MFLPKAMGANFALRSAAMNSSDQQQPSLSTKAKSNVVAVAAMALTAAMVLLVCYLFVRNTHRAGEDVRRQPTELPDTVSPDRAHGAR
jgi:hypothetical protein